MLTKADYDFLVALGDIFRAQTGIPYFVDHHRRELFDFNIRVNMFKSGDTWVAQSIRTGKEFTSADPHEAHAAVIEDSKNFFV